METLVVIAVITVLIVPVILIVAGCKLISAAKEFRKGKETQEKILLTLLKIQSELAAFRKDIGSVPVEKKALEKEIVPQSAGKEIYGKQTAAVPKDGKTAFVSASCEPEKKNGAERKNAPSAPVLVSSPEKKQETISRPEAGCPVASEEKPASLQKAEAFSGAREYQAYELPKSEFEKRTEDALRKIRNWICVGEEYRNSEISAEYAVATTWLIRIGILILVCGVGFFVKYSIDNNLVQPEVRVAGMLCAACGMVLGGLYFAEKRYHAVALGVIGLGFVTGYLGVFSAYRMYDLIGWLWAYGAMIFITVCAMSLSIRRNYLFPALVGTLGGYLTPLLLNRGGGDVCILFSYLTIISVGMVLCACFRNWKVLNILAFVLNTILYGMASLKGIHAGNYFACVLFFAVNYILFASLPTIGMLFRKAKITLVEILLHCGALIAFLCLSLPWAFRYGAGDKVAAWLVLGVACFALIQLPVASLTKNEDRNWNLMQLAFACAGFALFVPLMFSGVWITPAWAALAVVMMALGTKIPNRFLCMSSLLLYLILAVKVFLWDIAGETFFTGLAYGAASEKRLLTGGVFIAAMFLGGLFLRSASEQSMQGSRYDLNCGCSCSGWAGFFLAAPVVLFFLYSSFELHQALREFLAGFSRGGLSVWWGLWAVALLFFGITGGNGTLRRISLFLFGFCTLKIFIYDLANLSSLYKVTAFIILGILMLAGAVLYTRFRDRFSNRK